MNLTQNVAAFYAAKEISDSPTVSYQVGWQSTTLCKHGPPQHRTSYQRHEFRTVSRHVCASTVKKRNQKVTGNKAAFRCCLTSISVPEKVMLRPCSSDMLRGQVDGCLLKFQNTFKVHAVQKWIVCSLKTEQIRCAETSVTTYQTTLRNIPEGWKSQVHRGGNL
jgi:hypothetical protein